MCIELWSGFFGNLIGAIIGGIIAYLIVLLQIKLLKKEQEIKEKKENGKKEIQLLWQIYFDIKKDSENSNLWGKYEELTKTSGSVWSADTNEYINEVLQFLMRDIRNFFRLLHGKESEIDEQQYNELWLLWERAGQLLIFMIKIYEKQGNNQRKAESRTLEYLTEANDLFQEHNKKVQQS